VRVLTKYRAEKEILWYHWKVVDAACGDCANDSGPAAAATNRAKQRQRSIYKPAPATAEVGDVLPVSEEEWMQLAAVLEPDPTDAAVDTVVHSSPKSDGQPTVQSVPLDAGSKSPALAERLRQLWKK
jgi:hypothetical protein